MSRQLAAVVALIAAGEVFAEALSAIGAIDIIFNTCKNLVCRSIPVIIVMVVIISRTAFMGPAGTASLHWSR